MKSMLTLTVMMTANAFAVGRKELMPLIEEAADKRESAYVETRNSITAWGTNALPLLAEIAVDASLPWQQQLVARICYERIERKEDIEKLLATDWYNHPKFEKKWHNLLDGPEGPMTRIVVTDLKEAGLWYYYLEVAWKVTDEVAKIRDRSKNGYWASCCTFVVKRS